MNRRIYKKIYKRADKILMDYIKQHNDKRNALEIAQQEPVLSALEKQVFIKATNRQVKLAYKIMRDIKEKETYYHVQMVNDNYDVIHNPQVKEKYPILYQEVIEHDKISRSSWYDLSQKAYEEYLLYQKDDSIGYVK